MKSRTYAVISISVIVLAFAVFVVVIYAGSDAGSKSGDKCIECHSDSIQFKEWQDSAHAKALLTVQKEPKADARCLKCHSSDYIAYAQTTAWGATPKVVSVKDMKNSVSCSSCHRHGTGIEHNLIMPADKLCVSCHKFDCG